MRAAFPIAALFKIAVILNECHEVKNPWNFRTTPGLGRRSFGNSRDPSASLRPLFRLRYAQDDCDFGRHAACGFPVEFAVRTANVFAT